MDSGPFGTLMVPAELLPEQAAVLVVLSELIPGGLRRYGFACRFVDEPEGSLECLKIGFACLVRSISDETVVDAGQYDQLVLHAGRLQLIRHFQRLRVGHAVSSDPTISNMGDQCGQHR